MGNHLAIYSFSQSLVDFLGQSYTAFRATPDSGGVPAVSFDLLSAADFNSDKDIKNQVTLYLHRIALNQHLRNSKGPQSLGPIGLDLHFLLTVWLDGARDEQAVLGWAIRELHYHSFLDRGSLSAEAGWAVDEAISLVPAELSAEDMARLWEMARRGYRLSFPFLARIVRLGRTVPDETTPAAARRFSYTDNLLEHEP
jgi:hypothetical protein